VGEVVPCLVDQEVGEVVPRLGDQEANLEGLGACLEEHSFQEEVGVACSYLEVLVVHPCPGVEEAFPFLVVGVACPCLGEGEVAIHLTSLHQGEEEEEVDYCHPSQEGVVVEGACPSQEEEEYSPSATDTACHITISAPRS
jgi:hypothetical protein